MSDRKSSSSPSKKNSDVARAGNFYLPYVYSNVQEIKKIG